MALSFVKKPSKQVGGTTCYYNGVHQPIVFKIQRKDFNVSGFTNVGTTDVLKITISSTAGMTTGDTCYVPISSTASGTDFYTALYVITVIDGTHFTIPFLYANIADISFLSYVNLYSSRTNYYILTQIWGEDDNLLIGVSRNRPNLSGLTTVNIEAFLKPLVAFDNTFAYNIKNWRDISLGGGYYVIFQEWYDGAKYDELDDGEEYGYANAVKQIQEKYGTNLLDYYPNDEDSPLPKFMSDFVKPTYFVGFPFDLTYIQTAKNMGNNETIYDANGGGAVSATITLLNLGYINRMMLDLSSFPGCTFLDTFLTEGVKGHVVSETKRVKINQQCQQNPVYLCWLGKRGGMNYWCFNKTQTKAKAVTNATEFIPNVDDIETAIGYSEFYNKDSVPQLVLGATVSTEDVGNHLIRDTGISTLLDSVSVFMLSNPDEWSAGSPGVAPKWIRVMVQPGSFKLLETENTQTTIELIIDLPQLYNQSQ